jgi:uncharacterized protein with gpF-like domain
VESEDKDEDDDERVGAQSSDYARIREEKIAENKLILEKLFANTEKILPKHQLKSNPRKKLKGSEIDPRRESQSLQQGKQYVISFFVMDMALKPLIDFQRS